MLCGNESSHSGLAHCRLPFCKIIELNYAMNFPSSQAAIAVKHYSYPLLQFQSSLVAAVLKPIDDFCALQLNREAAVLLGCSVETLNQMRYLLRDQGFLQEPQDWLKQNDRVYWTGKGLYLLSIVFQRPRQRLWNRHFSHDDAALFLDLPVDVVLWLHKNVESLQDERCYLAKQPPSDRFVDIGWTAAGLRALADHSLFFSRSTSTAAPLSKEYILDRLRFYRYEFLPEPVVGTLLDLSVPALMQLRSADVLFTEDDHWQLAKSLLGVVWSLPAVYVLAALSQKTEICHALLQAHPLWQSEGQAAEPQPSLILLSHKQASFLTKIAVATLLRIVQQMPSFCWQYQQATYADNGCSYLEAVWTVEGLEEIQKSEYRPLLDRYALNSINFQGNEFKYDTTTARSLLELSEIFDNEIYAICSELTLYLPQVLEFGVDYVTAPLCHKKYLKDTENPLSVDPYNPLSSDLLLFSEQGIQRMKALTSEDRRWFYRSCHARQLMPKEELKTSETALDVLAGMF